MRLLLGAGLWFFPEFNSSRSFSPIPGDCDARNKSQKRTSFRGKIFHSIEGTKRTRVRDYLVVRWREKREKFDGWELPARDEGWGKKNGAVDVIIMCRQVKEVYYFLVATG
ncbi:hypothetical protein CEXT_386841 [Caerostris extrusa]|uniref:Uncharacterized protein n=1 Tax=Caerostris extrusa TaxID=172846 RepID=A0AAV4NNZ4_CAEEX|nr:hypothetical protein CEXT_386841 [Caerostris extrusa]